MFNSQLSTEVARYQTRQILDSVYCYQFRYKSKSGFQGKLNLNMKFIPGCTIIKSFVSSPWICALRFKQKRITNMVRDHMWLYTGACACLFSRMTMWLFFFSHVIIQSWDSSFLAKGPDWFARNNDRFDKGHSFWLRKSHLCEIIFFFIDLLNMIPTPFEILMNALCWSNIPRDVVFPPPLTPTIMITAGFL